jgi:hypothetical protein
VNRAARSPSAAPQGASFSKRHPKQQNCEQIARAAAEIVTDDHLPRSRQPTARLAAGASD